MTYDSSKRNKLTQAELKDAVVYNPTTGIMMCKETLSTGNKSTKQQRGKDVHRLQMKVNGHWYLVHRLAWLYIHGHWPLGVIDHINGDPSDNRLDNLRDVKHRQNCNNRFPYNKEV